MQFVTDTTTNTINPTVNTYELIFFFNMLLYVRLRNKLVVCYSVMIIIIRGKEVARSTAL